MRLAPNLHLVATDGATVREDQMFDDSDDELLTCVEAALAAMVNVRVEGASEPRPSCAPSSDRLSVPPKSERPLGAGVYSIVDERPPVVRRRIAD